MLRRKCSISYYSAAENVMYGNSSIARRRAFTLVELLVVIAIIGILVAMLLPAIQSAREAARRNSCLNNLKQVSLAVVNYADARKTLPPGAHSCCWGTWIVEILPYMEEAALYAAYDHTNKFSPDTSYRYAGSRNTAVTKKKLPGLLCPTDDNSLDSTLSGFDGITKHSYVVNGGNTGYTPRDVYNTNPPVETLNGVRFGGAPFSNEGGTAIKVRYVKPSKISDGLSKTLMFAETVIGDDADVRGFSWWGYGAMFHTYLSPNASQPDVTQSVSYCGNTSNPRAAPCTAPYSTTSPMTSASRSRHTGGVQASFCDGSARFISDDIELTTWRGLGTTRGGELLNLTGL